MVTARLAIGSVSTLALGALLLGSAPYLLNRSGNGSHAAPWGSVSALGVGQSIAAKSEDERAQLLKLAALKSGVPSEPASPAPPPGPVQAAAAAPDAQPVAQMDAAPVQPILANQTAAAPSEAPAPVEAGQQVASLDAPAANDVAQGDGPASKSDRININTASSSALDHLAGVGRIGHTIVSHRPYKNVKRPRRSSHSADKRLSEDPVTHQHRLRAFGVTPRLCVGGLDCDSRPESDG